MRAGGQRKLGDVAPRPALLREDDGLYALQLRPIRRYAAALGCRDGLGAEGLRTGQWRAGIAARLQSPPRERGHGRLQSLHRQPVQLQSLRDYLSGCDFGRAWAGICYRKLQLRQRLRGQLVFGARQRDLDSCPAYLQSRRGDPLHSNEPKLRTTRKAYVFIAKE